MPNDIWDSIDEEYEEPYYADKDEKDINDCVKSYNRDIYKGSFPNCAATVEEGSWCDTNDACTVSAIIYKGMENCAFADCAKAWK